MRAALVLLVAYAVALVHVSAFSMKGGLRNGLKLHMRMSEGGEDGGQTRMMSWPFQMFKAPSYLDGSLAGDAGFDPLGIASKETLFNLRECEIKNARIAMLASVGWPAAELSHRIIADRLRLPELLGDNDRVPSVLNGGLNNNYALFALGLTFAVGGVLELELVRRRQKTPEILDGFFDMFNEDGWDTPGNYGFDPLKISERLTNGEPEKKLLLNTVEIFNGRMSMLACVGFAVQETITGLPVVMETPQFFQPFTN